VADPLGKAVENCYALLDYAKSQQRELEFLLEFGRAVNSQGVHADSTKGLRLIVERSGLNWVEANQHLTGQNWREAVNKNMLELNQLGLWGVPCFQYGDTVVWGQDRLWVIEQAICQ
jgi:2-hydroxychromene-2-carboxylate isomerase